MTDHHDDAIPMELKGLILDSRSNSPIVLLRNEEEGAVLPIWIGAPEAQAIAWHIEGITPRRPMTHDLLASAVDTLGAVVQRVVISDLRDNTFYAEIHLGTADGGEVLDSRPSDAIALALRAEAPIFVQRQVLQAVESGQAEDEASREEQLRKQLEDLDPEDLGKYKM